MDTLAGLIRCSDNTHSYHLKLVGIDEWMRNPSIACACLGRRVRCCGNAFLQCKSIWWQRSHHRQVIDDETTQNEAQQLRRWTDLLNSVATLQVCSNFAAIYVHSTWLQINDLQTYPIRYLRRAKTSCRYSSRTISIITISLQVQLSWTPHQTYQKSLLEQNVFLPSFQLHDWWCGSLPAAGL